MDPRTTTPHDRRSAPASGRDQALVRVPDPGFSVQRRHSLSNSTVHLSLRPIRFGMLVDPQRPRTVQQGIELNTALWGGQFNPLIPVLKRLPGAWKASVYGQLTGPELTAGYVEAFDPDILVVCDGVNAKSVGAGNREVITVEELLGDYPQRGLAYGLGVLECAAHFAHEELRFVRRHELTIVQPRPSRANRLFLSSIFGVLPETLSAHFEKLLGSYTTVGSPAVTISDFATHLTQGVLFPRRLGSLDLDRHPMSRHSGGSSSILVMDAQSPIDVLDYWNLRATGWNVFPFPVQAVGITALEELLEAEIARTYRAHPSNPNFWFTTTAVRARSVSKEQFDRVLSSLKVPATESKHLPPLIRQHWYPRMWDQWARKHDEVEPCGITAKTNTQPLAEAELGSAVSVLTPDYGRHVASNGPRYANDVDIRNYGSEGLHAEVIPEADDSLTYAIGAYGFREWRFSRRGLVYLGKWDEWTAHLSLPASETLMLAWLKSKGIDAELSSAGRIAKALLKQLGGTLVAGLLAYKGVVELIRDLTNGGSLHRDDVRARLSKTAQEEKHLRPEVLSKRLVDVGVLKLVVSVQCPLCTQRNLFALGELDYSLRCSHCRETFDAPTNDPKQIEWHYATQGPLRSGNLGYSALSVILTLRFFSQQLDSAITSLLSFEAKSGGTILEADIALLAQASRLGIRWTPSSPDLLFVECKSQNEFRKKDVQRMNDLAARFPGAILVFATMREKLTDAEIRLIRPLAERGRRYLKAERSTNPVMILTSTELLTSDKPVQRWKEKGLLPISHADRLDWEDPIRDVCDTTQQIYLGMPSWYDWLDAKRKKKAARKKRAAAG